MIKLEHVVLASPEQMKFIIEGMRNPMNSWDKSDSNCCAGEGFGVCGKCEHPDRCIQDGDFYLGDDDHSLMQRLANAGTDHRKFMRMMPVYMRITAPLYWWKEFDTYKVGTVANSCSTMHKIAEKEFTLEDFSHEHMDIASETCLETIIGYLNLFRQSFLENHSKDTWWQMIQLLPSSYNQKRTVMLNYEVLANIYKSRKNHKLDEWALSVDDGMARPNYGFTSFCDWIKTLPYSELITGEDSLSKVGVEAGKAVAKGIEAALADAQEFLNKKFNMPDPLKKSVVGWRPIIEYEEANMLSPGKYDWVLVKQFDGDFECVPLVAEKLRDGKWYDRHNQLLPFEVRYFFDMKQLDKERKSYGQGVIF